MTVWIKLQGDPAAEFMKQYQEMLEQAQVDKKEFPPEMFVQYMLDIRKLAQERKAETDGK